MRVLEVGRRLDLGKETLGSDDRSQLRLQHFQGDLPLVFQVIREIHRRHPALTEFGLDAVGAFEGCVQAGDGVRHGGQDAVEVSRARAEPPSIAKEPVGCRRESSGPARSCREVEDRGDCAL